MNQDVECPYCEEWQEINHDDGQGYAEGVIHQQECDNCGKTFVFETSITFYYEAKKADCLNDGEHNWGQLTTYPKCFTKMQCEMCNEERNLTEEERIKHNIPTNEEYLKELNQNK